MDIKKEKKDGEVSSIGYLFHDPYLVNRFCFMDILLKKNHCVFVSSPSSKLL